MPEELPTNVEISETEQEAVSHPAGGQRQAAAAESAAPEARATFSAEYVRELRQEAARYRVRLASLERELEQERERAKALEQERAKIEDRARERTLQSAIMREAARLGVVDAEIVARLIDRAAIEFDEQGEPRNVGALVEELIKAKPYLRGGMSISAPNPARAQASDELDARLARSKFKKIL